MGAQSTYSYRARDATGSVVTGSLTASSPEEVGSRLRSEGKFVLSVDTNPLRAATPLDQEQLRLNEAAKNVRRADVISFCQQLGVMLETGVPLTEALDAFRQQTRQPEFRKVLEVLADDICSGEEFSTAMAKWPRVFPGMMISLMKASEVSGTMSMMLGRIGTYLAKERRTAKQIKGALSYPAFMIIAGLAMTVFLMTFVLPRFASIYESNAATLPTPTRLLLGVSDFVVTQYPLYLPVLCITVVGAVVWLRRPSGRRTLDWLRLNFPVLRGMYTDLYVTRFSRTMATLLAAGVNILDILDICRGITNNRYYDDLWDALSDGVRSGLQMSEIFSTAPFIPSNVASMIASGERSGRLPEVMERIAEFSEQELEDSVRQVTSFIEPIMIIAMGFVVGAVAMALLLPIFKMGTVVSGG